MRSLSTLYPRNWIEEKLASSRGGKQVAIIALLLFTTSILGNLLSVQLALSQVPPVDRPLKPLSSVPIPKPSNLAVFVKNEQKAIELGKSLFWDVQVGSDGVTSCASCHFRAGSDSRGKNQLHPGSDSLFSKGRNYQLSTSDYPFHKLSDVNNRNSTVLSDTNDVTGSQGVFLAQFNSVTPGQPADNVTILSDPIFNINQVNVRQVTGRNAPSVINAVFNFRNFWDGRAQNIFNGANPFGLRDPNAMVLQATSATTVSPVRISIDNASLASQAVGPPLSTVEESSIGRTFPDISKRLSGSITPNTGKQLNTLVPLASQYVAYNDSVLWDLSNSSLLFGQKKGLNTSYRQMIQNAFQDKWWNADVIVAVDSAGKFSSSRPASGQTTLAANEFTLLDYNFPLFFGLAVQLYESTLVSDKAPIDSYLRGNIFALSLPQLRGKALFEGKAKCIECHNGGELTAATVSNVPNDRLESMVMGDGGQAVYDNGFYNIGVRPTAEDLGVGAKDPFGNPLSESELARLGTFQQLTGASPNIAVSSTQRIAKDGAFKTPTLRNVELTAPYFHNGNQLTLEQVVDFYNRGGDFHDQNIANLDPDIENLGLSASEKADLVAFLKSFTDSRVKSESAPFDHPSLPIQNGHPGSTVSVTNRGNGTATDNATHLPARGAGGLGLLDAPRSPFPFGP